MSSRFAIWIPVGFALLLSGMPTVGAFMGKGYEFGFPAFFSFFPLLFVLVSLAQSRTQAEVRQLRERVTALEGGSMIRRQP
jgi:hypothetical protein